MRIGTNAISTIPQMREDFEGTIKILHDGGCSFLEPYADWGGSKELLAMCEEQGGKSYWDSENMSKRLEYMKTLGMSIESLFVFDQELEEQAEEMGKYCKEHGIHNVVVNVPGFKDREDVYAHIGLLKRAAKILKPYEVQLLKHNHEYELERITDVDGKEKYVIDIFLEQCTPEELMLEIDTGWIVYSGLDAVEFIKERIDRIAILHLKDICADYKEKNRELISVACGQGIVPFEQVFAVIPDDKKDKILYMLDQDSSEGDMVTDLLESIKYLNALEQKMKNMEV